MPVEEINTATETHGQSDVYGRAAIEKHHVRDTASTWKKGLCSEEVNNFLALCKMLCRSTLHIKLKTPSSIVLGGFFHQQGVEALVRVGWPGQPWMEVPSCSKHRGGVTKGRFTLERFLP